MRTLYDLLEVSRYASDEVIEKAYKILAKKYHPDLQTGDNKKIAEEKMKKINLAYETLKDAEKRKKYDEELERRELQEKQKVEQANTQTVNTNSKNINVNTSQNPNVNYQNNKGESVLDEKQRKKIAKKMAQKYEESYTNYLRSLGYNVKYKWTWERVKNLLIVIAVIIVVCVVAWLIPPIRNLLIDIYNENFVIKFLVNAIGSLFVAIGSGIKSLFSK